MHYPPRSLISVILLFAVVACLGLHGSPLAADEGIAAAEKVATDFLEVFAQKDIDTVAALFAPGALVQRARLTEGAPEVASFDAQEWAEDARNGIAGVEDFKMEILDVASASFGEGVTVSVQFRATGRVGENTFFINNGVDSFSMIRIDGEWRIILYNSMEKLEFGG